MKSLRTADRALWRRRDRLCRHRRTPAHPEALVARSSVPTSRRSLPISWPDNSADPIRVLAFNTLEHWSKDFSADVAGRYKSRCDMDGEPVPDHLRISSRLGGTGLPSLGSPRLRYAGREQNRLTRLDCGRRSRGEARMPLYHFDLVNWKAIVDAGGADLSDDIEAMNSADMIARRLIERLPHLKNRSLCRARHQRGGRRSLPVAARRRAFSRVTACIRKARNHHCVCRLALNHQPGERKWQWIQEKPAT